jgi:tetratricopeptide (TPR) repeat protein
MTFSSAQVRQQRAGRHLVVWAAVVLAVFALTFRAAPAAGNGVAGGAESRSRAEQVEGRLAEAWSAFYAGKFDEVIKLSEPLTGLSRNRRFRWAAIQAAHLQARCWWQRGGRYRGRARKIWSVLERSSTRSSLKGRLKIAKALGREASFDAGGGRSGPAALEEAIGLVEEILKDSQPNTATPEAAILLGRLRVKAGEFGEAKEALKLAECLMRSERTVSQMEISGEMANVFRKAARGALRRLPYQRDAGRAEFDAARKLQRAARKATGRKQIKKYAEALKAYRKVAEEFSHTAFGPRSELAIGHCLIGLKRPEVAARRWEKFIEANPAGPWRGQAHVALIDLVLEKRLDLEAAAEYAQMARGAVEKGLSGKESKDSWERAARDVWQRVGLVSICGGQGEVAAEAFGEAKRRTRSRFVSRCLERLIGVAKAGGPVIPEDVGGSGLAPEGRAALALSVGMVHHLAGRYTKARTFFETVGGRRGGEKAPGRRPMAGATTAQRAFAEFGIGAVLQALGEREEALKHFRASLSLTKSAPGTSGTWHDETLYRMATIIQRRATEKHAPTEEANDEDAEANRKAEGERKLSLANARADALQYWRRIVEGYPESPRRKVALFQIGVLRHELAKAVPQSASEKTWKGIATTLGRLCEQYPKSPYGGWAALRQGDVALERLFDLDLAGRAAAEGVAWADRVRRRKGKRAAPLSLPAWNEATTPPTFKSLRSVIYRCYARAGLVAYLGDNKKWAVKMYKRARRFEDSRREKHGVDTGMDRMVKVARDQVEPLTPDELLETMRDGRQKTGLRMADIALLTFRPGRAETIYRRLLEGERPFPRPSNRMTSYLFFRMGQALKYQDRREEAEAYLKRLRKPEYARYTWAADGIARLGTWTYNATENAKESMKQWRHVFTQNPDHPEAEVSLFFYGLTAFEDLEDYATAQRAFELYLERYPDSRWSERVREVLLPKSKERR